VGAKGLDVLVADNDPAQDLSVPAEFRGQVEILRTGGSAGFAEANNMAVRHGRRQVHDSVLLLNNDALLAHDALRELRAVLRGVGVGAVGPCMPSTRREEGIWACGGFIDKLRVVIGGLQPPADGLPCDVDYLPGAAILCRLDVWDLVEGLPERYFLTYEEAEFALRVKQQGYRVMVAPQAIVLHRGGMSADRRPMYVYNLARSRIRLGQYMWGPVCGFVLAAAATPRGAVRTSHGWRVWARAVSDEIRRKALDRAALLEVDRRYPCS
jgi:GT2 family glycosyltransferase